jgi:hypothetical protein
MPRKTFTPGEVLAAADVNTFLMDQSVMTFADSDARGSAIGTATEGMVTYLEDSNLIQAYNSTDWVTVANAGTAAYNFVETLYFTTNNTFTKATYPWLRAIRVKCVGGGGGGGGVGTNFGTGGGGGGGSGGKAESFITDIAGLADSVTVTVGSGGAGGAGNTTGTTGGNSTFSGLTANGATGGRSSNGDQTSRQGGVGGQSSGGDLNIGGFAGLPSTDFASGLGGGPGGADLITISSDGVNAFGNFGGGGGGAFDTGTTFRTGGAGANGIVILELYA